MSTPETTAEAAPTASLIIIGDEILSGRTQDKNTSYLANWLAEAGVDLKEVRIVSDDASQIGEAVLALKAKYTYVFTTGGIGPTHDDITADSVAQALGRPVVQHADAYARLLAHYGEENFTDARKRMTRVVEGATLIDNPVSIAPGFQIDNVFVMAGVPKVMQGMLEGLRVRIKGGVVVTSRKLTIFAPESSLADGLGGLQAAHPAVSIGSYPFFPTGGKPGGAEIVMRGRDAAAVEEAYAALVLFAEQANLPHEAAAY